MKQKDRELLELAARATGIYLEWDSSGAPIARDGDEWNPLSDDGDAFRLAVELGLDLRLSQYLPKAFDLVPGKMAAIYEDSFETVRRTIVEAAADIGKQK